MANMQLEKTKMPECPPDVRNKNFQEVAKGYSQEDALNEAARCLGCKNRPCVEGCPVGVAIPEFIKKVAEQDFIGAYRLITEQNALPAVCGRVCPQESQCEARCVRAIKGESVAIGRLERFVADYALQNLKEQPQKPVSNGIKVAVVGAGPAGLTCAGELARGGFLVTVYESLHEPGGVLVYGIPEFRLPKAIVKAEIEKLRALGVTILTNAVVGRSVSVDELIEEEGYRAVFIGSGAGLPSFMGIPGEGLLGVYSANEFLTRVNLMKAYDDRYDTPIVKSNCVAVVGGGNVAMDAARCAKRLGAQQVNIVYRRSEKEIPARLEEIHHAKEEGIEFLMLCAPTAINGDSEGRVSGITCVKMELTEPDQSGRRRPVEIPGSEFSLALDAVIMAIGTSPNPLIRTTTKGLEANRRGCIVADESGLTSRERVYAGGDAVTGAATVILAMGAGKRAASAIANELLMKTKN